MVCGLKNSTKVWCIYYTSPKLVGFLEEDWRLRPEKRITEVIVISNFSANIIRFSENANFFDSNFTVKGVLLLKKGNYLRIIYQKLLWGKYNLPKQCKN